MSTPLSEFSVFDEFQCVRHLPRDFKLRVIKLRPRVRKLMRHDVGNVLHKSGRNPKDHLVYLWREEFRLVIHYLVVDLIGLKEFLTLIVVRVEIKRKRLFKVNGHC